MIVLPTAIEECWRKAFENRVWVSIDEGGEALACSRADTVIALQDQDARLFRRLAGKDADVRVISPIAKGAPRRRGRPGAKLAVGDPGSSNWVNEQNLVEFIKGWVKSDALLKGAELVLGGGICRTLANFAPRQLIDRAAPRYIGSIDRLQEFFDSCDIFVNPERGGTGIKIKTLDAMAHGVPVLSTSAGFVGIESQSCSSMPLAIRVN